jgi:hypothetical protein
VQFFLQFSMENETEFAMIKKLFLPALFASVLILGCRKAEIETYSCSSKANESNLSERQINKAYNKAFYTTVLDAAKGIAKPFLLVQGYVTLPGVTVNGNSYIQNGISYTVSQSYQNPSTSMLYYIYAADYNTYHITSFSSI